MTVPAVGLALLLLLGGAAAAACLPAPPRTSTATRITTTRVERRRRGPVRPARRADEKQLAPAVTAAQVNRESLGLLMDTELTKQFGEPARTSSPTRCSQTAFLGRVQPLFTDLPATRSALHDHGLRPSGRTPVDPRRGRERRDRPEAHAEPTRDKLLEAGLQVRQTWLKNADITTDPRYGPDRTATPAGTARRSRRRGPTFAKSTPARRRRPRRSSSRLPAEPEVRLMPWRTAR